MNSIDDLRVYLLSRFGYNSRKGSIKQKKKKLCLYDSVTWNNKTQLLKGDYNLAYKKERVCPNIGMRRFMSVQMIKILVVPSGTTYVIVMAKIKKKNVPKHHVAFQLTFKQNNSKEKSSSLCTSNDFCFIYQVNYYSAL